ncbi:MAG: transposase [bacterium]
MSLDDIEFIRRFLQHVLPPGFMKVRHYGFFNPNSGLSIETISQLITLLYDVIRDLLPKGPPPRKKRFRCSQCGHELKFLTFLKPPLIWRNSG